MLDNFMGKVITIANPKGGVGKTTTAINLAASLAIAEKSVLVIGMDPNGSLSAGCGIPQEATQAGIYELYLGTCDCVNTIHQSELPKMDLIPCNINTHEQELRLEQMSKNRILLKRKLYDLLIKGRGDYDFIIIDTPPSVSDLTISALYTSHSVLIPLQTGYFSLRVVERLLQMIHRIKKGVNPDLTIEGILLNFYERNTKASQRTFEEARKLFGNLIFNTVIPKNTALGYAAFEQKPLVLVDACAPGAVAYLSLADELLKKTVISKWSLKIDNLTDRSTVSFVDTG